jgi:undecaprenyl-diphosphatase
MGDKYMSIIDAIILGLVQGIAEFLPISSSGHLAILHNLFNMSDLGSSHMFFDVLLHFGTLIAICFMYWNDIKAMLGQTVDMLAGRVTDENGRRRRFPEARMFMLIIVATLPLVLILPINDYIESLSNSTIFVGIALILTGCMLLVSDKMEKGTKTAKNMRFSDALIIGLCQCVATLPGLSRSGTTITAGIATGQDRSYAVKFSLLMSIPAVLGATLLELIKAIKAGIDASLIPAYLFGMIAAMISGVLSIGLLKMIARKTRFGGFSYYCWVVGVLTVILSLIF